MAKSFHSQTKNIGSIIGNSESRIVEVPRFQRGFSWEKTQVNAFWADVLNFRDEYIKAPTSSTYFFGPIVIEETSSKVKLLDGQQRLATVTILLAAIRDAARTLVFPRTTSGADFARDIQRTLIEKEEEGSEEYSLKLSELDRDFFRKSIQEDPLADIEPTLKISCPDSIGAQRS